MRAPQRAGCSKERFGLKGSVAIQEEAEGENNFYPGEPLDIWYKHLDNGAYEFQVPLGSKSDKDPYNIQAGMLEYRPIMTGDEKALFEQRILGYMMTGDQTRNAREHSFINYDAMCEDWNKLCEGIEKGTTLFLRVYRKSVGHLKAYYKKVCDTNNRFNTMLSVRNRELGGVLRQQGGGFGDEEKIGILDGVNREFAQIDTTNVEDNRACLRATGFREAIVQAAAEGTGTRTSIGIRTSSGGAKSPSTSTSIRAQKKPKQPRKRQTCTTCGHFIKGSGFAAHHAKKATCTVPEESRRPKNRKSINERQPYLNDPCTAVCCSLIYSRRR